LELRWAPPTDIGDGLSVFEFAAAPLAMTLYPVKTYNIQTLSTLSVVVKQVSSAKSMQKPTEIPAKTNICLSAYPETARWLNLQKWKKSC
jgi:hypothetical protein